jgi:hypothetical protein
MLNSTVADIALLPSYGASLFDAQSPQKISKFSSVVRIGRRSRLSSCHAESGNVRAELPRAQRTANGYMSRARSDFGSLRIFNVEFCSSPHVLLCRSRLALGQRAGD